jgi:hypothetical protein
LDGITGHTSACHSGGEHYLLEVEKIVKGVYLTLDAKKDPRNQRLAGITEDISV